MVRVSWLVWPVTSTGPLYPGWPKSCPYVYDHTYGTSEIRYNGLCQRGEVIAGIDVSDG